MHFEYETPRLELRILNETYAKSVLQFYKEGKDTFNQYEPPKPDSFYTEKYQEVSLRAEYNAFLAGNYVRYYIVCGNMPDKIIGTVSFSNILRGPYQSCILGYKLLPEFQKNGYATEAASRLITAMFEENGLHRIEAYTLPDNYDSIGLLLRLGFDFECLARSVILLQNGFTDHNKYVLINPMH